MDDYTPEERKERRAVEYLRAELNLGRADAVLAVYKQIIEQDVFHTRVGIAFLEELRAVIKRDMNIPDDQIPAIPGTTGESPGKKPKDDKKEEVPKKKPEKKQEKKAEKKPEKKQDKKAEKKTENKPEKKRLKGEKNGPVPVLMLSVFLNIVLIVMVVIMFILTITSDSPNIINYKSQLEDEYAAWDEELTRREKELKQKEAEFNKLNAAQNQEVTEEQDTGDTTETDQNYNLQDEGLTEENTL